MSNSKIARVITEAPKSLDNLTASFWLSLATFCTLTATALKHARPELILSHNQKQRAASARAERERNNRPLPRFFRQVRRGPVARPVDSNTSWDMQEAQRQAEAVGDAQSVLCLRDQVELFFELVCSTPARCITADEKQGMDIPLRE